MSVLFVFAHPDDEAYGPAGTIAKIAEKNEVYILSLCKGDRPGQEHVSDQRVQAFYQSCLELGAKPILKEFSDCKLEYASTLLEIEDTIRKVKPSIVYTHCISDLHKDHRLVAECCMVACRPKPGGPVNELYFCEMPTSTAWPFGQLSPIFSPNVYIDVSKFMDVKKKVLSLYSSEVYAFPDARSGGSVETLATYRGYQCGIHRAEAFQLIFFREGNLLINQD